MPNRRDDPGIQPVQTYAAAPLEQVNTFGVERVAPDPNQDVKSTILKFGTQLAGKMLDAEVQANYVAGQTLHATGGELDPNAPLPTRKGFMAMDAKLRAQAWLQDNKRLVDEGDNDLDPIQYATTLKDKFKTLLTGDREVDNILTQAAGSYAAELGAYQRNAHFKKRTADGITQATADVRNQILAIKTAVNAQDIEGEKRAREGLTGSLKLPTVLNTELRQQMYGDLAVLGLELGDASVLNHLREQEVKFTPEQEKRIISATAAYNRAEENRLSAKYQNDIGDFEAYTDTVTDINEWRERRDEIAEKWPGRVTDKYLIAQESAARVAIAKGAATKVLDQALYQGELSKVQDQAKIQETIARNKANILKQADLTVEQKDQLIKDLWLRNGIKDNGLAMELTSGLAAPIKDGKLHPNFQPAFEKAVDYYRTSPDLMAKHLSDKELALFLDTYTAVTSGGQSIDDIVPTLVEYRAERAKLSRDEQLDFDKQLTEEVDEVLGKGWFNWNHGPLTSLQNEPEVRTKLNSLAKLALGQGMRDPKAAVEFARTQLLKTHEQLGNSLVFNNGEPFHKRMGIPPERVNDAMDYLYADIEQRLPGVTQEQTIIMGDPKNNSLLIGVKNEFDVITRTLPVDMRAVGENFKLDVLAAEQRAYEAAEDAESKNVQDQLQLIEDAQQYLGWTRQAAESATTNALNRLVTYNRVRMAKNNQADQQVVDTYNVETMDQLEHVKNIVRGLDTGAYGDPNIGSLSKYLDAVSSGKVSSTSDSIQQYLESVEGNVGSTYADSLGIPTAGIGHKLTEEEQRKYPIGTPIPESVRNKWFREDTAKAKSAAQRQIEEAGISSPDALKVMTSVNFQLGTNWHKKFPSTWELIKQGKYKEAAQEVQLNSQGTGPSKWKEQTPVRVAAFVDFLNSL